jgi:hypothetical protein
MAWSLTSAGTVKVPDGELRDISHFLVQDLAAASQHQGMNQKSDQGMAVRTLLGRQVVVIGEDTRGLSINHFKQSQGTETMAMVRITNSIR